VTADFASDGAQRRLRTPGRPLFRTRQWRRLGNCGSESAGRRARNATVKLGGAPIARATRPAQSRAAI